MPLRIERNPEKMGKSTGEAESQRVGEVTQATGSSADGSTGEAERMLPRTVTFDGGGAAAGETPAEPEAAAETPAEPEVVEKVVTPARKRAPRKRTTARTKATGK